MSQKQEFLTLLIATLLITQSVAQATDIYKGPVQALNVAKPNVIFGMDDSGSMDFEVMLTTNDGAFWWNDATVVSGVTGSGWDTKGIALFNATGNSGSGWTKMPYLFPNGCGAGQKINCDASGHYATPPTSQFASLRSKDYNPLYYDPTITYQPWANGVISGVSKTFPASTGTAAPSHPLHTASTNLTATTLSTATDTVFMMRPGMKVPAGTSLYVGSKWVVQSSAFVVAPASSYTAAFSYYPATYWIKQPCSVDDVTCTRAPDGATLKRYEIKSGNSFPTGRSYANELQNFANWFTYYRKRKLMLSASMGSVLSGLSGMRVGLVNMNAQSVPTMFDIDNTNPLTNAQTVIGKFYQNPANGGTPTRSLLNYIGNQFKTNTSIIESSCQRNAAFIVTDGFAENTSVTPPAYTSSSWNKGSPYETTFAGTLADIASSFYTNNLRTDLAAGKVPTVTPTASNPGADNNPNLHMNTYAITLGAQGTLWNGSGNAYATAMNWPNPVDTRSPTAVDDLWHATVNSRGAMFTSRNPNETAAAAQTALTEILKHGGSQGGVSFSTLNLKPGSALAYVGSYRPQGWSGDISAYAVDTNTGALASAPTWSADALLQAREYPNRAIATFNGTSGVALDASNVGTLVNPGNVYGVTTDLIAYLRGNRTLEGSTYRTRNGLLGADINAEQVSLSTEGVVFATTNEGMVHALVQATGNELWAYMPGFALAAAGATSQKAWAFQTILDGTPTLGKANGHFILVGGRGTAGSGFYALDVTNPKGSVNAVSATQSDSVVASRVLWEFPSASTPTDIVKSVGVSMGKPVIVNTHKYGPVVVLTSGYNSTLDGKGRVFVFDAMTGSLLHTFVTTAGTVGTGDAGLAQLAGFSEADGYVNNLYGGDLLGNVWRFGIEDGSVLNLATLTDSGAHSQPVTSAPELATLNGKRLVFVGTGQMLGKSDFGDNSTQSFYALWDNNTSIAKSRASLAVRTITVNGTRRSVVGSTVDWSNKRGWYVDLPAGEKANTDPSIAYGVLSFTTNSPSANTCTSRSALYLVNLATGLQLANSMFADGQAFYGVQLTSTLTARVSISRLPSGSITVTTHQSDDSTTSRKLAPTVASRPVKTAWKAILK